MAANKKKVIFIGGTAFSGSTFFDLILANDPAGFSCGEVRALFHPSYSYHIDPECGCGDRDCNIWKQVRLAGTKELYTTIFDLFPDIEFIVDSSKDPYWIRSQANSLLKKRIESKHILIWKTPLELAHSYKKRGKKLWHKAWINYHRMYLTAINSWRSVKYSDFTKNPDSLKRICQHVSIPYFPSKNSYWEKKHHTLFGNTSARIHLKPKNFIPENIEVNQSDSISNRTDPPIEDIHRTIYYKAVDDQALKIKINHQIAGDKHIPRILDLLNDHDISRRPPVTFSDYNLRLSGPNFHLRTLKRQTVRKLMRYRNTLLR